MKRGIQAIALIIGFFVGYQNRFDVGRLLENWLGSGFGRLSESGREILSTGTIALLFLLAAALCGEWLLRVLTRSETAIRHMPVPELLASSAGITLGLLMAALLYPLLSALGGGGPILALAATVFLVWSGYRIARSKGLELWRVLKDGGKDKAEDDEDEWEQRKILDTSVIIDGRIADICKTGFIEGTLVIPEFILEELQHIADSSDLLKRNRGRRGLDILNKIQKELDVKVEIYEGDFEEISEVDSKLVRLAKVLGGKVLTNDFNLNKVCELQGVSVLNINDLANAVKPVVLPGEEIVVQVIKDGKEHGQGVAYLDDGTMIVVEGGREYIGTTMEVMVTSVLQTSAGRMIFAKPKLLEKAQ
ncbi:PIN/TRAM domain-containing protein [Gorillibacterium timonense]|uniref:PIN/TRAM domain-containing protein n=1 Tax=Gorillibacterium timonense TaxID=1689269 RepID=UPI00071C54E2|nr:PIN/TRAM domain-containing protein [Gorillibacterium timonense]